MRRFTTLLDNKTSFCAVRRSGAVLTLFAASILTTLLFWMILPAKHKINESSDYTSIYEPMARNILEGRGIVVAGEPFTRTPPGYAIVLAGVFGLSGLLTLQEEMVHSTFILLCVGLSTILVFFVAARVWGVFPALASSIVWTTYPLSLWLTKQPGSELPFLVVFFAAFGLFVDAILRGQRAGLRYFLSGSLMGIAMLIRPIAIGLGLVLGAIIWLVKPNETRRVRLAYITVVLLGNVVAVLPWQAWVFTRTGKIITLSTAGPSSIVDGLTYGVDLQGYRFSGGVSPDVSDLMQHISARKEEMRSVNGILLVGYDELTNRPLTILKLIAVKVMRSWYGTDKGLFDFYIVLIQIPYLVLVLRGTRVAWRLGDATRQLAISVWLIALYFWVMTIAVVSIVRYMVPAIGLLFLLIPGCALGRKVRES